MKFFMLQLIALFFAFYPQLKTALPAAPGDPPEIITPENVKSLTYEVLPYEPLNADIPEGELVDRITVDGKVLVAYVGGMGRPELATYGILSSLAVTIILDLLLIPRFGINGASITSSVSYTVYTAVLVFFYLRHTKARLADLFIIQREDIRLLHRNFSTLLRRYVPDRA